jgi:hypothetical protein
VDRITPTHPLFNRLSQRFLKLLAERLSTSRVRHLGRIQFSKPQRTRTPELVPKVHQKVAVLRTFAGHHPGDFLPRSSRTFPHFPAKTVRFAIGHVGHSNAASFN